MFRSALAIAILVLSAAAQAQPDIGDYEIELVDGQPVTIRGSAFGQKQSAAPTLWNHFDNGTAGAKISSSNSAWNYGGTNDPADRVEWDDTHLRDGGGLNVHAKIRDLREIIYLKGLDIRPGEKAFFSFWWASSFDPALADHYKVWRICDGPIDVDTYPDVTTTWLSDGIKLSCRNGEGNVIRQETGCGETQRVYGLPVPSSEYDWQNVQIEIQVGTMGQCNGYLKIYMDGSEVLSWDFVKWISNDTDESLDVFWLGNYVKNSQQGWVHSWFDDVYVDKSWARIEIGDDPVYDNCTQREMQIPSSWSDGEIVYAANQGSFAPGEELYLFVTDSDGRRSQGRPVTFSGGGFNDTVDPVLEISSTDMYGTVYGREFVDGEWQVEGLSLDLPVAPRYLYFSGTASDNVGISRVEWSNSLGGSGVAAGGPNWTIEGVELGRGTNVISITCYDFSGNNTTVEYTIEEDYPGAPGDLGRL